MGRHEVGRRSIERLFTYGWRWTLLEKLHLVGAPIFRFLSNAADW
jgi:hypothetical protein